jgi:hypothetical protein
MSTPEGQVKDRVKELLAEFKIIPAKSVGKKHMPKFFGWYFMPVKNMLGVAGVPDVIGHYRGHFFSIETKAPGKKPTGLQALQIELIRNSGGKVFVVDGEISLRKVQTWLLGILNNEDEIDPLVAAIPGFFA